MCRRSFLNSPVCCIRSSVAVIHDPHAEGTGRKTGRTMGAGPLGRTDRTQHPDPQARNAWQRHRMAQEIKKRCAGGGTETASPARTRKQSSKRAHPSIAGWKRRSVNVDVGRPEHPDEASAEKSHDRHPRKPTTGTPVANRFYTERKEDVHGSLHGHLHGSQHNHVRRRSTRWDACGRSIRVAYGPLGRNGGATPRHPRDDTGRKRSGRRATGHDLCQECGREPGLIPSFVHCEQCKDGRALCDDCSYLCDLCGKTCCNRCAHSDQYQVFCPDHRCGNLVCAECAEFERTEKRRRI